MSLVRALRAAAYGSLSATMAKRGALIALAVLAGCGGTSPNPVTVPQSPIRQVYNERTEKPGKYIKHVVIIVQENRSFDNLFAGFPGANAPMFGYAGNVRIKLHETPLEAPGHAYNDYKAAMISWNHGEMNGFNNVYFSGSGSDEYAAYAYVPRSETAPYWSFAKQYVLADNMFPTEFGASFTAHLSLIAGNTNISRAPRAEVDAPDGLPWGCDAPPGTTTDTLDINDVERSNGPFPCFTRFRTLADRLDEAGIPWKYYAAPVNQFPGEYWSEFSAIRAVRYGPDWNNVVSPPNQVLNDVSSGKLADVSWVTPDWQDSDHDGSGYNYGPSWVTSIINTIGQSQYWNSTAIVVLWDEWGGWYDNVPPPQLDFRGLGIRVGCIIVSPYARMKIARGKKRGYISHTVYEYGSILKFVEQVFGLPRIGSPSAGFTDTRANSIIDSFDFTQRPRGFARVAAPYSAAHFRKERPSYVLPDKD